ncbi:MAG: hypothetical protein M1511_13775 [Deltaproteobacteria bacterium]|nr:hypothetical protein [Deltaproteobacteria bacterium]
MIHWYMALCLAIITFCGGFFAGTLFMKDYTKYVDTFSEEYDNRKGPEP